MTIPIVNPGTESGDEPVRTTRARLKGVTPDELKRRTRDDFGQVWVRP